MFKSIKIQPCKNNVGAIIDTDIQSADPECINEIKIAILISLIHSGSAD